jgi:hypothetical protein
MWVTTPPSEASPSILAPARPRPRGLPTTLSSVGVLAAGGTARTGSADDDPRRAEK